MSGMNYTFDATQHDPVQLGGIHPIGKFAATISHTEIKGTKDNSGGMFIVTFSTEFGTIPFRYNLWNTSQKAADIAHKQLSALCHAVGIYQVQMQNEGTALRNARLMIEVGKQNAESEYTEVKHVYCADGSEPGKAKAGQPQGQLPPQQPQTQQAPVQQQAPQGWAGQGNAASQQQQQPQTQPQGNGWGSQPQAPAQGGWMQSAPAAGGSTPPWAA